MNTKLTMEQKKIIIATNHYCNQFSFKVIEDSFPSTPSYDIQDRWISEVLELDYRKDIYNDRSVSVWNRTDAIKNKFYEKYKEGWFIGDALMSCLYKLSYYNVQDDIQIQAKEDELREMWAYFSSLIPGKSHSDLEKRIKVLEEKIITLESKS